MIQITEIAPGYFRFESVWTAKPQKTPTALLVTLTLTGPDGIETEQKLTWTPPVNRMRLREGSLDLAEQISAVQSWRAVQIDDEISIGVADPEHYSGRVEMELR